MFISKTKKFSFLFVAFTVLFSFFGCKTSADDNFSGFDKWKKSQSFSSSDFGNNGTNRNENENETNTHDYCLEFKSSSKFDVYCRWFYQSSTFEYSYDKIEWKDCKVKAGTSISSSDENENGEFVFYLRGNGSSSIGYQNYDGVFRFDSSDLIYCSGNVETLLDWQTVKMGEHPKMDDKAFIYLFSNCDNLATAPELPATTLSNYCYQYMFYKCTSLT